MKRTGILVAVILLATAINMVAQPAGYKKHKDINAFKLSLAKNSRNLKDISSNFTQVKSLALLSDKLTSKGRFYYQEEDKVRIEYTEPYKYLLVMNGNRLLVNDGEKTSKINTGNSKIMQSVNEVMTDCVTGNVFNNADFKVEVYENEKQHLLELVPVTPAMGKLFEKIEVYISKNNLDVNKLVLKEKGGDYTKMDFYNVKHNTGLDEALFKTK